MIRNYLKTAWRSLRQSKTSALINLSGLAVGMAAFLLIMYFVRYEMSFDADADSIYRVTVRQEENRETGMHSARTYAGIAPALTQNLPQVEMAVRVLAEECLLQYRPERKLFNNQKTYWADAGFHQLFGLNFVLKGNLELLNRPHHAVMSISAAKRFFGEDWSLDKTPVGKTIWLNGSVPFMLQGVYKDLPANSHLAADFIVSYNTLTSLIGPVMETAMPPGGNFAYNYVRLQAGADAGEVAAAMNEILISKIPESSKQNLSFRFDLQPVKSIHLSSHLADELRPNGNAVLIYSLTGAALLILIIAWINFINLSTARAMERAKEVGVRKALGADRKRLIGQFMTEGFLYGMLAALLSLLLVFAVLRPFQTMTGISAPLFSMQNISLWGLFAGAVLLGGGLASLYPAFVLSSFRPVKVLKGSSYAITQGGGLFRKLLIIFQFSAAILLLCCTGAVYFQANYMKSQHLGMDTGAVLVIHSPRSMIGNATRADVFKTFREEALKNPAVLGVGSSACLPGKPFLIHREDVRQAGVEAGKNISYDLASVDEGYLPVLGASVLAGRNFSERRPEQNTVIINEKAVQTLGFGSAEEAVGGRIKVQGSEEREIIGVVNNVHYRGLQNHISPLLLYYGHDYEFGFFTVKINAAAMQGTVARLEQVWSRLYPNDPFDSFFLDSFFNEQYQQEQAFGRLFSAFTLLGVLIACLGLFGLVLFTVGRKQKEIAIRKVLGSGTAGVFLLITGRYFRYILVAVALAVPASHILVSRWLQGFAYHFRIAWWMYLLPVVLIGLLALLTVSFQAIKAAVANPVKALRAE